ncbi:MAG: archaemetzincin family Zn-dependent metalloprotease [Candidatus Aminicenantes bacterium]|nr:archaemetzincin family Zn-dependent metalloprotease [Candidatus Aminicenantes bacterium]
MEAKINIIPLNRVEEKLLLFLKENLAKAFQTETKVADEMTIGRSFCNLKRKQYQAYEMLKFMMRKLDFMNKEDICIGIFKKDMYTPPLNFVFGLASKYPRVCLISLARLHPSFNKQRETENTDDQLYLDRILKEAVHEIGHTLELEHCKDSKCVMHFSNTLDDTDTKGYEFCKKCRRMI